MDVSRTPGERDTVRRRGHRWWTRPGHFVLLGALLFVLDTRWLPTAPPAARRPVTVATADQIDDELLFHEALAQAIDRRDPIVRQRLVALARYLGLADAADDAALEREARALGLQRSDPTVRRHLIEMMRLTAARIGPPDLPDEAALRAYYAAHAERFTRPARSTLTHVYLSRDRHGDGVARAAASLLAELRAHAVSPEAAAALGDPFARGAHVSDASSAQLARSFGPEFAAAIDELPERVWSGPVASPYGLHLVFVEARRGPELESFASARNRVIHELLRERGAEHLRAALAALRARYDVRIVPAAVSAPAVEGDVAD
jgi:parvulin-like peptidyl-prolyl isomerase